MPTFFFMHSPSYSSRIWSKSSFKLESSTTIRIVILKAAYNNNSISKRSWHCIFKVPEFRHTWRAMTRSPGSATFTRAQSRSSFVCSSNRIPTKTFLLITFSTVILLIPKFPNHQNLPHFSSPSTNSKEPNQQDKLNAPQNSPIKSRNTYLSTSFNKNQNFIVSKQN